jgi:hypothetical protein
MKPDGWWLKVSVDLAWISKQKRELVTTETLGRAKIPDATFVNPDGTSYRIDKDYYNNKRKSDNPAPGPFEFILENSSGLKVWPVK